MASVVRASPRAPAAPAAPATTLPPGGDRGDDPGGARGGGGASQPPPPSAIDAVLPPLDGDLFPPPPPTRDAYLALLIAVILEATVPSLQCHWGVLLVCWFPASPLPPAVPAATPAPLSLLDLRNTGLIWTPVLFSASWSVADPWSETLGAVHGHPRLCSLVGAVLLTGGLFLSAVGAAADPASPLLPLLTGVSAGIAAGVGASLLSRSGRLVLDQRWGVRAGGAGLTQGAGRFVRALGLTVAPLAALSLCRRFGPGGALVVAATACLPALLAPAIMVMPRKEDVPQRPSKYERLTAWRLSAARRHSEADVEADGDGDADADARTEISDDGGSVTEQQQQQQQQHQHGPAEDERTTSTVVAEVHFDEAGARQQPGISGSAPTLSPEATARLDKANGVPPTATAEAADNGQTPTAASPNSPAPPPRPLYGEGGAWNQAYSFDCDGDDDIELFVRRLSPARGPVARLCSNAGSCCRGCRADLRPALRPSFHLSLYTLACCRLANLALPVLLPALTLAKLGGRARLHLIAALPAVAGVGAMLFGLTALWKTSSSASSEAASDGAAGRPQSWMRFLGLMAAQAAVGFLLLSWGRSHWWLMLGCLNAGYGAAGATWAQRHATREAMGGATAYRAQPLLCVATGLLTAFSPLVCGLDLSSCMAVLSGLYAALSAFWFLQPHLGRFC